ncbi:MAG: Kae1-associated serine/threonine protein kinase [Halobacteriales archaeon]|nr:Kae1-associated serine/threonine protein kinase [Halobacteriales archaeon]
MACNERLRAMVQRMCAERGAKAFWPIKKLCVDNGAMIAWTGLLMHERGQVRGDPGPVQPRQRTDDVEVTWREPLPFHPGGDAPHGALARGAEALVERVDHLGRDAVAKRRLPKGWRAPELDQRLRSQRTKLEARLLGEAKRAGVRAPVVYDAHAREATLTMERLPGERMREALERATAAERDALLRRAGEAVGKLHAHDIVHGDLTTSNLLVHDGEVMVIDFGLGHISVEDEDKGVDLHVLHEALQATHARHGDLFPQVWAGYAARYAGAPRTAHVLDAISRRGRYKGYRA